jgi:hypothetical protein
MYANAIDNLAKALECEIDDSASIKGNAVIEELHITATGT